MNNNWVSYLEKIPDYPTPGVTFIDLSPIYEHPHAMTQIIDLLCEPLQGKKIDKVVAPEARGFIMGSVLAERLGAGFVQARKPGKLPRKTIGVDYDLEYGTDRIEIHEGAILPGEQVLIFDDLLATGGTAGAVRKLIEISGAELAGYAFLISLEFLNPKEKLFAQDPDAEILILEELFE